MKNIIVCCDGTWNRPGTVEKNKRVYTNVEIIYRCIAPVTSDGVSQVKFYESGVGSSTYDFHDIVTGGLSGLGIDKRIMNIYSFIAINYEPGDNIYLFGFSRGAYTARSVAGLIRNCGLLTVSNAHLTELAYQHYRDRNEYAIPDSDFMRSFRQKLSIEPVTKIKFIGVWDTVGALGMPLPFMKFFNNEKYKFHDVKLSSFIENAFHAIAIDEHRQLFMPTLWTIDKPREPGYQFEQRWFSGSHSNVGGGYGQTGLSDIALDWMALKAKACGLEINDVKQQQFEDYRYNPDHNSEIIDSRRKYYKFWTKYYRPLFDSIRNRKGITNEVIDESVSNRYAAASNMPSNYRSAIDFLKSREAAESKTE